MLKELLPMVPPDALDIALVLALAFFVGLEREEHKQREPSYAFGGVTTFPLIGLVSYALALIWRRRSSCRGRSASPSSAASCCSPTTTSSRRAAGRPRHRDLRARDLRRRRLGPARPLLDRDDDRRAQRAPPRAEEGARGSHEARRLERDHHRREVPRPGGGHPARSSPIATSRAFISTRSRRGSSSSR